LRKSVIYYTDGHAPKQVLDVCLDQVLRASDGCEFIRIESEPPRGVLAIYDAIIRGLEQATGDWCFLAEHDVLYPPDHFAMTSKDRVLANTNVYCVSRCGCWDSNRYIMSGVSGPRDVLLSTLLSRLKRGGSYSFTEPNHAEWGVPFEKRATKTPYLDVRHGKNFTGDRSPREDTVETLPYWGDVKAMQRQLGLINELINEDEVNHGTE